VLLFPQANEDVLFCDIYTKKFFDKKDVKIPLYFSFLNFKPLQKISKNIYLSKGEKTLMLIKYDFDYDTNDKNKKEYAAIIINGSDFFGLVMDDQNATVFSNDYKVEIDCSFHYEELDLNIHSLEPIKVYETLVNKVNQILNF